MSASIADGLFLVLNAGQACASGAGAGSANHGLKRLADAFFMSHQNGGSLPRMQRGFPAILERIKNFPPAHVSYHRFAEIKRQILWLN